MIRKTLAAACASMFVACTADQVTMQTPPAPDPNNPMMPMNPMDPMNPMMPPYTGPTYHRDIEPLLQDRCQTCHRTDGIAPFSMLTFQSVVQHAPQMVTETAAGRMPPWGAVDTDECHPRFPF